MKVLQVLSCLLLIAAIAYADEKEDAEQFEAISKECGDEQGLSKDEVEEIPRKICTGGEMEKNRKCQIACFYNKLGAMKDGEILEEELKEAMIDNIKDEEKKEKMRSVLNTCKEKISGISDECEMAFEFTKCMMQDSELCKKMQEKDN